ncbi:MAG: TIGR03619 family F420-dependent LLM class oxidoreductase [Solirubrobacterales bacterium]
MKIGFHVPQWGRSANREGVLAVARSVEAAGLDSVWVADHVVLPIASRSDYPYAKNLPFAPEDGFLEALTELAVIAGATERITLGTSVLVMPMRHPVMTAKVAATIDVLAEGRLTLAMGAGWWQEEFEALDAPFPKRGRRFDEQIRLMRQLWSEGTTKFDGDFYSLDEIACEPRPIRQGGPPLLIGGMGPPAWRRVAALGDGWHAVGVHEETLVEGMNEIRGRAEAAGRDFSEISFSTSTVLPEDRDTAIRRLRRLKRIGISQVILETNLSDYADICQVIEDFAAVTRPAILEETEKSQKNLS